MVTKHDNLVLLLALFVCCPAGAVGFAASYQYDDRSQLTHMGLGGANMVDYAYDEVENRLRKDLVSDGYQAPLVATGDVDVTGPTSAIVTGIVSPYGGETTVWFEWGNDSSPDSNATVPESVGKEGRSSLISAAISGLIPGETYTYLIVAENGTGRTRGAPRHFSTPFGQNAPPVAVADDVRTSVGIPVTFDPRRNDADPERQSLTIQDVSAPRWGTLSFTAEQITYVRTEPVYGTDVFSYTISDGFGGMATGEVRVSATLTARPRDATEGFTVAAADTSLNISHFLPSLDTTKAGDTWVAWEFSDRNYGCSWFGSNCGWTTNTRIAVNALDENGATIYPETIIDSEYTNALDSYFPAVATDPAGNAFVVYDQSAWIHGRRVSADGTIGPEREFSPPTPKFDRSPDVCSTPEGNWISVFKRDPSSYSLQTSVFLEVMPSTLSSISGSVEVDNAATRWENPKVACLASGDPVVVWVSGDKIKARRFNSDLQAASENLDVSSEDGGSSAQPAICAMVQTESYVVVWRASSGDGRSKILAQLMEKVWDQNIGNYIDVKTGPELVVSDSGNQPNVACNDRGDFVVVWQTQDRRDIDMRAYFADRTAATGTTRLARHGNANRGSPVAGLWKDRALVVWAQYECAPFYPYPCVSSILGQFLDIDGLSTQPIPLTADLMLTRSASSPLAPRQIGHYTLHAENLGPTVAKDVIVSDGPGLLEWDGTNDVTFIAAVPAKGSCTDVLVSGFAGDSHFINCEIGDLDVGERADIDISFIAESVEPKVLLGNASSQNADPDVGNNQASVPLGKP